MTDDCRVYWGSHGCALERGHDGPHVCDCCTCIDHATDHVHGSTDPEDEGIVCVGAPPYYGVPTRFYGEDVELSRSCWCGRELREVRGTSRGWCPQHGIPVVE